MHSACLSVDYLSGVYMICFNFYPQWNYKKIELWLAEMEHRGYRLDKVICYWWFSFVKARPRNAQYIFTYNFIKESAMFDCEHELRSRYNANLIESPGIFYVSIYRETHGSDLTAIVAFRQSYLKHVFIQKMIIGLILSVPAIAITVYSWLTSTLTLFNAVFVSPASLFILYTIWYAIGLYHLKKRNFNQL